MFATLLTHHDRTHPHTVCPTLPHLEHWTPDLVAASPCLHPSRRAVFLPSHVLALALAPFHPPFLCLCPSVDHPSQSAPSCRSRNICVSFVLRRHVLRLLHSSSASASMWKDFWSSSFSSGWRAWWTMPFRSSSKWLSRRRRRWFLLLEVASWQRSICRCFLLGKCGLLTAHHPTAGPLFSWRQNQLRLFFLE